jgi:hypothetical protein
MANGAKDGVWISKDGLDQQPEKSHFDVNENLLPSS